MARYFALLGRRVEVQYRAGDILLPATGTLAADSGKSIFLEEHFFQRGTQKTFRWEIPYQCIIRLTESPAPAEPPAEEPVGSAVADKSPAKLMRFKTRPEEA
jgi:hypothetical protein